VKCRVVTRSLAALAAILSLAPVMISGQAPASGPASKPPRTPDNQPDLQGIWQVLNTAAWDIQDHSAQLGVPASGNFHSEELHVVERFTRTGPGHINYEVTIEDPKVFTRPWKMSMPLYRRQEKDIELLEYECYAYLLEENWGLGIRD